MNGIEKEFNTVAAEYETNRLSPWYKAHAREILDALPPLDAGNILDVGCGTGYLLRELLQRNPQSRGIGIDIADGMVAQAQQHAMAEGIDNARFIKADWESFGPDVLADYPIRVAICANAFHYFADPGAAARKFFRVLAPGGILYVLERNKASSAMTLVWGWLHRHIIKDHVSFYSVEELQDLFRNAGFSDVRVVRTIKRFLWKSKLYTSIVLIECVKS